MESADPFFENIVARQSKEPVSFNDNAISSDKSSDLSKSSNELPHPNKSFAYVSAGPLLNLPPCTRLTQRQSELPVGRTLEGSVRDSNQLGADLIVQIWKRFANWGGVAVCWLHPAVCPAH